MVDGRGGGISVFRVQSRFKDKIGVVGISTKPENKAEKMLNSS